MKYTLNIEEEDYSFGGWAFLHFHTLMPSYAFACCLNRLYDYNLMRVDDVPLNGVDWPLYRDEDMMKRRFLFLVERPAAALSAPWDAGDKLLIVKGECAETTARQLFADFTGSVTVDEGDLLAREHADLLESLMANFTVVNILDFSTPPVTRKAIRERTSVRQHCDALLDYIDQKHLDLTEIERMHLEMRSKLCSH